MTTEFLEKLGIKVHSETDSEIRCFCPFHEDDNPSSSFSKSKGVFNCFVCGGETLDSLIDKLGEDGLEYSYGVDDLQKKLKEMVTIDQEEEDADFFSSDFVRINYKNECPTYLLNRISFECVTNFDLHLCSNTKSKFDKRIIFPVYYEDKKSFVARDYTDLASRKYLFPSGMKKSKYIFGEIGEEVIVVEGVFDVMKLWDYGFKNSICVFGISPGFEQIKKLLSSGVKRIILYADGDDGGLKLIQSFSEKYNRLFEINFMVCNWGLDPADMSKEDTIKAYKNKKDLKEMIKPKEDYFIKRLQSKLRL